MPPGIPPQALEVVRRLQVRLADALTAVYLYGSFVEGGLRAGSDLDLLCVLDRPLDEDARAGTTLDLLALSVPPGQTVARALEVTCVVAADIVPWRHPARRDYQFGEWLRPALLAGRQPRSLHDSDLALLIAQARAKGIALHGPAPVAVLPAVPAPDIRDAILAMLPEVVRHLEGEELHALLTLARMWVTLKRGEIVSKDVAAAHVLAWLPEAQRPALARARAIYLGDSDNEWTGWSTRVAACAQVIAAAAQKVAGHRESTPSTTLAARGDAR